LPDGVKFLTDFLDLFKDQLVLLPEFFPIFIYHFYCHKYGLYILRRASGLVHLPGNLVQVDADTAELFQVPIHFTFFFLYGSRNLLSYKSREG